MKRSPASAWNFLLSLEGQEEETTEESSQTNPKFEQRNNELLHLNDGVKLVIGMVSFYLFIFC